MDLADIFSTYVEMNRMDGYARVQELDFLYVCGDEPI